tara:strand:- start:376 stop:741 length:366 start_codon:yes stop_codon:yes gene_type:complete
MPELNIDKHTRWVCQKCGKCCTGPIISHKKDLSIVKNNKTICKFLNEDAKLCSNYNERPFICKIYPFIIDMNKIVGEDKVARPRQAFLLENLKIHSECEGYGKGKRIYINNNIQKKLKIFP